MDSLKPAQAELTSRRKDSHLDICANLSVEPRGNETLLECVQLVHCAMPELAVSDVDLRQVFLGKTLSFPIMITGMTGGSQRATEINRCLAELAENFGLAFGVGSQRAMVQNGDLASSFQVRHVAPTALIVGNLGLLQARELGPAGVLKLMHSIDADALAIHLNPAQELTQPEGDRDFRHGYSCIESLAKELGPKLMVKETGCGISPSVARRLAECGVQTIDVSGLGGTSWIKVEQLRSHGEAASIGEQFAGWGIPTAASIASVRRSVGSSVCLVASGGIRTGLDIAKAMLLGADIAGLALPIFRALERGGLEAAATEVEALKSALTQAMLLTGSRTAADLRSKPAVVSEPLRGWVTSLCNDGCQQ